MVSISISRWIALCGALVIAAIAADSLVPVAWQIRLGAALAHRALPRLFRRDGNSLRRLA
jgi:hypothetical protein